MSENTSHRWRFSLKSLAFAMACLSLFLALTFSGGQVRRMSLDGPTRIVARHYGWPVPYLRIPTGTHSSISWDVFLPGLFIDLALAILVVAAMFFVLARFRKAKPTTTNDHSA
jgi:hypothetical protein